MPLWPETSLFTTKLINCFLEGLRLQVGGEQFWGCNTKSKQMQQATWLEFLASSYPPVEPNDGENPRNGCYTTSPQVKSARVSSRWQQDCGGRGEPGQVGKRVEAVELDTVWLVVLNIFYFQPYLGEWSNLTNIFQLGWNHQLDTVNLKTDWWLRPCVFCIHETVEDSLYSFVGSWICPKLPDSDITKNGEIELWAVLERLVVGCRFLSLNNWGNVYSSPVCSFFFGAQRTNVPSIISDRSQKTCKTTTQAQHYLGSPSQMLETIHICVYTNIHRTCRIYVWLILLMIDANNKKWHLMTPHLLWAHCLAACFKL